MEDLESTLSGIIQKPLCHGRFLLALSHMEYVGARKIAKALPAQQAQGNHLEHLMEEARHATLLRFQADALLGNSDVPGDLTARAEQYLQAVDRGVEKQLTQYFGKYCAFDCYLAVSLVIEERAMQFYPLYHRLLPEGPIKGTISSILKDEVGHLEQMQANCQKRLENADILAQLRAIEGRAYTTHFLPMMARL